MISYRKVVPLYTTMVVTAALLSALSACTPSPAHLLIPTPFPSSTPRSLLTLCFQRACPGSTAACQGRTGGAATAGSRRWRRRGRWRKLGGRRRGGSWAEMAGAIYTSRCEWCDWLAVV